MTSQRSKREALTRSLADLPGMTAPASSPRSIVGAAMDLHTEGLAEKLARFEREAAEGARLIALDPVQVREVLPADRDPRALADEAFAELRASIEAEGQHVPIIVRAADENEFELVAGRRRLAACRELGRKVLARVLPLDNAAMLLLQYSENAQRRDISAFERGRWLLALSQGEGLSTTQLGERFGLSQPLIVEYLKLARLPEAITGRLDDPRELTIAQGRQLTKLLKTDKSAAARMGKAIEQALGQGTAAQVRLALANAQPKPPKEMRGRVIRDRSGRKLLTLTRSGNQWVGRFAPGLDEEAVAYLTGKLPDLLETWRESKS